MKCAKLIILATLLMLPLTSRAEGLLRKLMALIDTLAVTGIDRNYIDVPKHPWQVILRGNISQSSLKLKSTINGEAMFTNVVGDIKWEPQIKSPCATATGFWLGYRGYGVGYTFTLGSGDGRLWTFGISGGRYGVNLRIHSFNSSDPEIYYDGMEIQGDPPNTQLVPLSNTKKINLHTPIHARALMFDAYYFFNGKHFSYAAAYDQSAIQKRSAGSLSAGVMYYHSHIHYESDDNVDFLLLMDDIGRIKQWQFSGGIGYAYNWVPCRGLLVSTMVMPMLTFYNRHKTWRYGSNLRDFAVDDILYNEDDLGEEDWKIYPEPISVKSSNSAASVNFDARLSVTYQWRRFYVNANGQFSTFRYKDSNVKGHLNDWYINTLVGVRF